MREKERKYCYGMYTLMFLLMCMAAFLPFFMGGKNFVWGAGVEDGLSQHFSALAYYGELLREFVKNLIAGHPKLMMWNMSLGYGADVIATLNYYAIGDPLNLLYGFVPVKYTEIKIFNLDNGKEYLVTSGLNSGDKIVIEGVQNLKDGQKVQPITPAQKEANYQQHLKDQHDGNLATAFN